MAADWPCQAIIRQPSFSHERFFEENTIMAVKKVAIGSPAAPTKADEELVQEAYGEALKKRLGGFFDACIDNHQDAEARFVNGLKILRDARDRALELV
jgi:hypothetical protein